MYAQKEFTFSKLSGPFKCPTFLHIRISGPASIFINAFSIIPFLLIQGNFFLPCSRLFHTILGYASVSLLRDLQQIFHQCMALLQQIDLFL